jgi:sensor histidine kinase YesM
MDQALQAASHTHPRLRRFTIDLGITAIFNVAIAAMVTYVLRIHDVFSVNLVISMCIGTLMVSIIDGGRLLLWGTGKPPVLPFTLLFVIALPVSLYLGNEIASLILGIPAEKIVEVRDKNLIGFFTLFLLACMSATWFFWSRSRVEQLKAETEAEKARVAAIEKQAMQAQLQMLQAQIEPHMLFNTLANLQSLVTVDAARAQQMLDQLIQYLRATLSSSRAGTTSLAHEFTLIEAYLGLMKVRMGARLSYTLELPEHLRDTMVPPMLLQPLVENAIKHGLEPAIGGGHIAVIASQQEDGLHLSVIDTGLGLDIQCDSAGTHIGVANTRERLHALYGTRASFSLLPNTPTGAIAQLTIPL